MLKSVDRPARPTQRPTRRLMLLWNLFRGPRFWIVEKPKAKENPSLERMPRRRHEWMCGPLLADVAAATGDSLQFISREQIIVAYHNACVDAWDGEIPPGYERRFTRWHLS